MFNPNGNFDFGASLFSIHPIFFGFRTISALFCIHFTSRKLQRKNNNNNNSNKEKGRVEECFDVYVDEEIKYSRIKSIVSSKKNLKKKMVYFVI